MKFLVLLATALALLSAPSTATESTNVSREQTDYSDLSGDYYSDYEDIEDYNSEDVEGFDSEAASSGNNRSCDTNEVRRNGNCVCKSGYNRRNGRCQRDQSDSACDYDKIFRGQRQRAGMTRSARSGSLKQDYPKVWQETKQARNKCKNEVGNKTCRDKGLCGEAESEDEDSVMAY
eukprot:CAMPEP_0201627380 /NCGR_PEP_ID=MMETSP0493-20130528/2549_1 /ASSEMBLY_ACC=CAM_ASM_000838 /TAXON_ID=420259 /ORGANISM="Thalassiosira gravida, Strain GMp14c1" /LENGTH=175 /DNA_ID=CAMNT_0048097775 /DNA_START=104 /DNA_END=631 /DNA_ORIENTATION=-